MKRVLFVLLVSILASSLWSLGNVSVSAVEENNKPRVLTDCSLDFVVPCIEEINVRTRSGRIIPTTLSGRSSFVDPEFVGKGYPEYSVRGLSFEGTSKNLFIPRIVYYRYPSIDGCDTKGFCESERDFLALGVQPSWLNRWSLNLLENEIPLSNRPSNLLCGTAERREKCYRSNNFEIDIDFLFKLRMPRTFNPMWASGSARNITIEDWSAAKGGTGETYSLNVSIGTLEREMVLFSDYYKNPIDAIEGSPYADFKADWPGIWIHSSRDRTVNPLGECRDKPFLSVSTNGIYQEVPLWNPQTETIDLKLYAPHLKVGGGINRGFYQLRISEELAKCFWKIGISGRTQARVLITYPDSSTDVIVETTKTSFKAGVLEVLATNFTFSSPTIRTRIFSPNPSTSPSSMPTPSNESTGSSSKTMDFRSQGKKKCVKGSVVSLVSQNKKCPAGFKRAT